LYFSILPGLYSGLLSAIHFGIYFRIHSGRFFPFSLTSYCGILLAFLSDIFPEMGTAGPQPRYSQLRSGSAH
jgi:hypothetical protein